MVTLSENPTTLLRRRLTVRGQVQGVGFRPFVYRLAGELALAGFVRNDGVGVTMEIQGESAALADFVARLRGQLPPLARIDHLEQEACEPAADADGFRILFSDQAREAQADVAPDMALCDACLTELRTPGDRRHGYPFINCTNCGPRYSIVADVPYDRPLTTMSVFRMCPACQAEYDDPADRRFHAQPNACPDCGPSVWLMTPIGARLESEDPIADAAAALLDGRIIAIRGLGGYHLACRADDQSVVQRLRDRKNREHKPLAVMVADESAADGLVKLPAAARAALLSPQRPIVIARRRPSARVADAVAQGTDTLGVMLPYTPLHHLLFDALKNRGPQSEIRNCPPLVMTSGNLSDEPIVCDNVEAVSTLGEVADLFLAHDRDIHRRIDDSVVQAVGANVVPLRRARGFVPVGMELPVPAADHGLAVGGELKNTVAMVRNRGDRPQAILSEHIGDLKDGRVYRHFERVIEHLAQITHTTPAWIAHDLHPMYLSSSWARRQGLRLIGVQHHHAHIASCMVDNGRIEPVVGIAADGVGYGPDGTVWGGEVLVADLVDYKRVARMRPFGLPGGDAAALQTARPAAGWLFDATGGQIEPAWLDRLLPSATERDVILQQLRDGINTPASSALGRYFDAAAAILGVASANRFEAEAPMALEAAVAPACDDLLPFELTDGEFAEIDFRPVAIALAERAAAGEDVGRLAATFHNTVAAALARAAARAAEAAGIRTVALSGGCFANCYLMMRMAELLVMDYGLELMAHRNVPSNDGGLALGQAAVGAARAAGMTTNVK